MLAGLWAVVPHGALRAAGIGVAELSSLFEGEAKLDLAQWAAHTALEPAAAAGTPDAQAARAAFFGALGGLDEPGRARLFQFVTGLPRLPPGGFAALRPPFTLQLLGEAHRGRLPVAHTCFNALQLAPLPPGEPAQQAEQLAAALATSVEFGEGTFSEF